MATPPLAPLPPAASSASAHTDFQPLALAHCEAAINLLPLHQCSWARITLEWVPVSLFFRACHPLVFTVSTCNLKSSSLSSTSPAHDSLVNPGVRMHLKPSQNGSGYCSGSEVPLILLLVLSPGPGFLASPILLEPNPKRSHPGGSSRSPRNSPDAVPAVLFSQTPLSAARVLRGPAYQAGQHLFASLLCQPLFTPGQRSKLTSSIPRLVRGGRRHESAGSLA